MKVLRIILIAGILGLIALLGFLLFFNPTTPGPTTGPEDGNIYGGGQQDVVPLPDDSAIDSPVDVIQGDLDSLTKIKVIREPHISGKSLITDLVTATSPQFEAVSSEFYLDDYVLMTCENGTKIDKTIMFTAKPTPDPVQNHYRPAFRALDKWVPFAVRDIGWILYPKIPDTNLVDEVKFDNVSGTDVWKGTFDSSGFEGEIYYSWLLNYVFISSSFDCLEASKLEIYAPQTH